MKRCLLLQHGTISLPRHQIEPLATSARTLARHGWRVRVQVTTTEQEKVAAVERWLRDRSAGPAAVMIQIDWRASGEEAARIMSQVRERLEAADAQVRLVFLDHYDGVGTPHLSVLPHVDVYLKKQLPRDLSLLAIGPDTGGALAERIRELYEPGHVPAQPDEAVLELLKDHAHKLHVGWNLGAASFLRARLFRRRWLPGAPLTMRRVKPQAERANHIHCRVGMADHGVEDWYRRHRRAVLAALEALPNRYGTILGASGKDVGPPIPQRQFRRELEDSRICVSPFGYGEICYRDFEAVTEGCVLAKPDMSHVRTEPDIYIAGETYIPFRLDLSDLPEALEPYLADPERCQAMVNNARQRLADYFRAEAWAKRFLEASHGPARA